MPSNQQLDNETFLAQFENQTLDPVHFSHLGHLRLAWLYLNKNDVDTSVELVCTGIRKFAESLGANTKFHLTMTNAFVRIMAQRIETLSGNKWSTFISENQDLVENASSVIGEYYSNDLLLSEAARTSLVAPDLRAL